MSTDVWEKELRELGLSEEMLRDKLGELERVRQAQSYAIAEVPYTPVGPPTQVDLRSLVIGMGAGVVVGAAVGAAGAYYLSKDGEGGSRK